MTTTAAIDPALGKQLLAHMMRAFRALKAIMREEAARHGLSMTQFIALRVLDVKGELTMGDLRACLDITQGAATSVVDRLIQRQLAARELQAADRRVVLVRLTDAGRALLAEILAGAQAQLSQILDGLPAAAHQEVLDGFASFARALDARPEEGTTEGPTCQK